LATAADTSFEAILRDFLTEYGRMQAWGIFLQLKRQIADGLGVIERGEAFGCGGVSETNEMSCGSGFDASNFCKFTAVIFIYRARPPNWITHALPCLKLTIHVSVERD
jgi:hypothetical protein